MPMTANGSATANVPNWVYGFGFTVNWKQFYFGAFFQGVPGLGCGRRWVIPFNNSTAAERSNLYEKATDRWTVDNPYPQAFLSPSGPMQHGQ